MPKIRRSWNSKSTEPEHGYEISIRLRDATQKEIDDLLLVLDRNTAVSSVFATMADDTVRETWNEISMWGGEEKPREKWA